MLRYNLQIFKIMNWKEIINLRLVFVFTFAMLFSTFAKSQGCIIIDTVILEGFCYSPAGTVGSITIVPLNPQIPGNPPPYQYSINGISGPFNTPPTDSVFTNVLAGTYDIWVVDVANPGCSDSVRISIPEPQDPIDPPNSFVNVNSDLTCWGDSNGVATVTAIGGVMPYTYLWPSGETTQQANGLWASGTDAFGNCIPSQVIVTDAIGCQTPVPFCIDYLYSSFDIVLDTLQQVQCFGDCNGEVTLNASGAVPPYTFSWSNGQSYLGPGIDTAFNLCQGGHSVIIQDAYGCDTVVSFTIAEPPILYAQANAIQPVQCYGFDDGQAYSIATGGASPYSFSWGTILPNNDTVPDPLSSSLHINDTIVNLTPGIHIVMVTDTNFCTAYDTVLITEPDPLVVEIQDTFPYLVYPYCLGTNSGQLCAIAYGGSPDPSTGYQYSWNNTGQLTACAYNLAAGVYTVSVIDARSCVASDSFDLDSITNTMIEDSVDITVNHISCNALYDGSILVNYVGGGVGPFTYNWNGPGTFSTTGTSLNGLYQGTYSVVIEDDNGCILNTSVDVLEPNYMQYNIDYVVDESCSGDGPFSAPSVSGGSCNGQVILDITGGTSPYYYDNSFTGIYPIPAINQSPVINDTLIDGFCDGLYNIHITDANGCEGNLVWGGSFQANVGEGFVVYIDGVKTIDASCFNTDDGIAWVEGGPDPLLNYTWESNNMFGQPSGIVIDTLPYSTGFLPGSYWLVAHFADSLSFGQNYIGCDVSMAFTMSSPTPIVANEVVTDVTCFGDTDGSIDLTPAGGDGAPYTFLWDTLLSIPYPNITNEDQIQLAPGVYTVRITDVTGCVLTQSITVSEPNPIINNFNVTDVLCHGDDNGIATANIDPNSGASPFIYLWNDPLSQNTPTASGLSGGIYSVVVTDAHGCLATFDVTIVEPDPIIALVEPNSFYGEDNSGNPFHVRCKGENNGSLVVINSGGTGVINYQWENSIGIIVSTNQNTGNILPAGEYTLTVTDDNGCIATEIITLNEPNELEANVSVSNYPLVAPLGYNISCYGLSDGWALSEPIGGYAGASGYQFEWVNNLGNVLSQQDIADNLAANYSYTVTVRDANGCEDVYTTSNFIEPLPFVADVTTINYAGPIHAPFTVDFVDNTSSLDPYYFDWVWLDGTDSYLSGTTTFSHQFTKSNIGLNEVYVVLTNESTLCTDTVFFAIDAQGIPDLNNVFTPNSDGVNDFYDFGEHEMESIIVHIYNRWGQEVYAWEGTNKIWTGVDQNGQDAPDGAYFYVLKAQGIDGYYYERKGTITLLR